MTTRALDGHLETSDKGASDDLRHVRPSLLDRLTIDGDRRIITRVMTSDEFKQSLRRNLEWVFKARCHPNSDLLDARFPLLASSSMNYGLPTFRDDTLASLKVTEVIKRFRRAVLRFEPRIRPGTLRISVPDNLLAVQRAEGSCVLHLVIEGEAVGFAELLTFRAEVNVATGDCSIGDERRA